MKEQDERCLTGSPQQGEKRKQNPGDQKESSRTSYPNFSFSLRTLRSWIGGADLPKHTHPY